MLPRQQAYTESEVPMFDAKELDSLDSNYFTIIYEDPFDITIRSKNTGHYWSLHSPDCPERSTVIIFHSHRAEPFHMHGRTNTLRQAVRGIKRYDKWQMNGRKW